MVDKAYNFDWNTPFIKENNEEFSADKLNRATYAKFLTNFLIAQAQQGYVLNLNSSWGTGKTYFLKRWQVSIEEHHPTVYIDAWKQDFSDDPMMTVVSSITAQLRDQSQDKDEQAIRNIGSKAWGFCKHAAPEITKAVIKKVSGISVDEILDKDSEEDPSKSDEFAEATGKVVAAMFKDHEQKLSSIEDFKKCITEFIDSAKGCSGKQKPTFIFIDELDRCRPSYAVEMLEVIKHFFDMPYVIFVVATDTEQLQHAVKAVYGNDFDANVYLGRFFKRRCTLKEQPRLAFIVNHLSYLTEEQTDEFFPKIWPELDNDKDYFFRLIASISDIYNLSLRESEQLTDKVLAILLNLREQKIDLILLCSLIIIHEKYYAYYQTLMGSRLTGDMINADSIQSMLPNVRLMNEVEIEITPSVNFPNMKIVVDRFTRDLDFTKGKYDIHYRYLLRAQLSLLTHTSSTSFLESITKSYRHGDPVQPLDMAGIELEKTNISRTKFKDWVELATTFE
ncbi:P-loop NTPase fold protein [Agarivorans sp. 1_MG-2023]|uniref:KAP family P-loop NTPase fold protein n=1 Tax=Agarivorans sp. 1_MG-2023 TaxID=3062634 RepID=UPI0026E2E152|nr:P-loop NTPase fold protein [Agarivorans sp. 1_MG-2023]MDO6763323.1 P-loop NTPase fold protein [Agarivorans sp. 1_MG-2023]